VARPITLHNARLLPSAVVAAGFVLMWSSGFIGAKLFTTAAGTFTLLMWRFLIAAGLLVLWRVWVRRRRRTGQRQTMTRHEVMIQVSIGILAQGVYLIGVYRAEALGLSAGTTALVAALQPLLAGALAGPLLKERVTRRQWMGLGGGLVGVLLVVGGALPTSQPAAWVYSLPLISMLALTGATVLESKAGLTTPLGDAFAIQCGASAGLFTILALATGQMTIPVHPAFWLAMAWFIALSTIGAYGCYWLALRRTSATRVSSLIYLTPPTTMVWAFLMFDETVTPVGVLGIAVCLGAVILVVTKAPSRTSRTDLSCTVDG